MGDGTGTPLVSCELYVLLDALDNPYVCLLRENTFVLRQLRACEMFLDVSLTLSNRQLTKRATRRSSPRRSKFESVDA
jgi:hypothetical protein